MDPNLTKEAKISFDFQDHGKAFYFCDNMKNGSFFLQLSISVVNGQLLEIGSQYTYIQTFPIIVDYLVIYEFFDQFRLRAQSFID